jgi:hypothetical protein
MAAPAELAPVRDRSAAPPAAAPLQARWLWVLGLIGLDYFSTLGYQPSLAFEAAGLLAPLATAVLVLVTLFVALPVYAYIAGRSPNGQGSLALLERLVPGWTGKGLLLLLLGFAATDFVFLRTLSAADAAEHLVHNPNPAWQSILDFLFAKGEAATQALGEHPFKQRLAALWNRQMVVTVLLLTLGFLFWWIFRNGFTRTVLRLSVFVVGLYLLLNAVVIGFGLNYLTTHDDLLRTWWDRVLQGDWQMRQPIWSSQGGWAVALMCVVLLPKLALGLSGFELSMVLMPLVKGDATDTPAQPRGRIRNTRKLLVTAALVMSVFLLGSALVTSVLIPPAAFVGPGGASNRALAYLAHGGLLSNGDTALSFSPLFGYRFGTLYDFSTVTILCLAGCSVAIGLRDFVPPYLHGLGMELNWAHSFGILLHLFNVIKLLVTVVSHASVEAQRGAYAMSVMALMTAAGLATLLDRRQTRPHRRPWVSTFATALFALTTLGIVVVQPNGLGIAGWFILAILITSIISRWLRSTELRCGGFAFVDEASRFLWDSLVYLEFPVLVPHRPGHHSLADKEQRIREQHRLGPEVPIVFVEIELGDPSDFAQVPLVEVKQEEGRFLIRVRRCASVAHVLAAVGLELSRVGRPPEMHFGWSNEAPLAANLNFVLFGQGNVPWMVRELIKKAEPDAERRPRVVIG